MIKRSNETGSSAHTSMILQYFEKLGIVDLIVDRDGKFCFLIDDSINIELTIDNNNVCMQCYLCDIPLKVMTKDRLLSDIAKNSLLDMKNRPFILYIDTVKKLINAHKKIPLEKVTMEIFEYELGVFIDTSENYKRYLDKILRYGELTDIRVSYTADH